MAPKFLPLLFIFYLSCALLSPGATVCVPRSGPYNSLLRDYLLPPPNSVDRSSDSYAASPSPSTSPSTTESSSVTFSDTSGPHIFDSDAASPSPSTSPSMKSSSPQSVKPQPSSSSPSPQSVKPQPSSSSPTPKSATAPSTTTSSSTASRSPLSSPATPVSSTTLPPSPKSTPSPSKTPAPLTPSSSPSDSPSPSDAPSSSGMVEAVVSATADAASSAMKATSNAASSVTKAATKAIKSKMTDSDKLINVIDGSLNAICDKLPFPDLCMTELPSAAEDDIKAIDLNRALGLAITDLLIEARAARDKARTLVTNDFVYDPINLCNRTMGGALSDSKDALASYELKDWGSVKSNFDSYVHRLGVCTEKQPEELMAEMEKMDKLWQNANAILCTIDPTLKSAL